MAAPLCDAAWVGNIEAVQTILKEHPEFLNVPNARGQSPLFCAARQGHTDIAVQLLMKADIDLNYRVPDHGGTALHAAGFNSFAHIVALLLSKGADPNVTNNSGISARQEAKGAAVDTYQRFENDGIPGLLKDYPIINSLNTHHHHSSSGGEQKKDRQKKMKREISREKDRGERKVSLDGATKAGRRKSQNPAKLGDLEDKKAKRKSLNLGPHQLGKLKSSPGTLVEFNLKIFGTAPPELATIEQLLEYDKVKTKQNFLPMPIIIKSSIEFLMMRGLDSEGLFRVPGRLAKLNHWEDEFNSGRGYLIDFFKSDEEPEDVASLLKKYLRDMPDKPLFTHDKQKSFAELLQLEDQDERIAKFQSLVTTLPRMNQIVIRKLLWFLMQVSENSSVNRMTPSALAIVFGSMAGVFASEAGDIVQWAIEKYSKLYEALDISEASENLLLRKLVTHPGPIIGFLVYEDYMLSFDSKGAICIRNKNTYAFVRTFDTQRDLHVMPVLDGTQLYCAFDSIVIVYEISEVLNPEVEPAGNTSFPLNSKGLCMLCVAPDEIWLGGAALTVGNSRGMMPVSEAETQMYRALVAAGDGESVWCLRDQSIEQWHKEELVLQQSVDGTVVFGADCALITFILVGTNLWVSGRLGTAAMVWVLDTKTLTVTRILKKTKDVVNAFFLQDENIWTVSADGKIFVWENETFRSSELSHTHSGALTAIAVTPHPTNGLLFWTGADDRSVIVQYLSKDYLKNQREVKQHEIALKTPRKSVDCGPQSNWFETEITPWVQSTQKLALALAKHDKETALQMCPPSLQKILTTPAPKMKKIANEATDPICPLCVQSPYHATLICCGSETPHIACLTCLFGYKETLCPFPGCEKTYTTTTTPEVVISKKLFDVQCHCTKCPWNGSQAQFPSHECISLKFIVTQ